LLRREARFQGLGGKIHFRGNIFVFVVLKTNISGHNKIWEEVLPNASTWLRAWQD